MPSIAFRVGDADRLSGHGATFCTTSTNHEIEKRGELKWLLLLRESGRAKHSPNHGCRKIDRSTLTLSTNYIILLEIASTVSLAALGIGVPGPNTAATPLSYKNW